MTFFALHALKLPNIFGGQFAKASGSPNPVVWQLTHSGLLVASRFSNENHDLLFVSVHRATHWHDSSRRFGRSVTFFVWKDLLGPFGCKLSPVFLVVC